MKEQRTEISEKDSFKNSGLIQLLKLFTKEERAEFAKFVHSPFNPRTETARFFDALRKYFPSFEKKGFTKENVFSSIYPGEKYRDDVIRRLSSNLLKLAEEYIAYKIFREDEFEKKKRVLDYFSRGNNDYFFLKQLGKIESYLKEQPLRNSDYFYKLKQVNTTKAFYYSQQDATRKKFDNTQDRITQTWHYVMLDLLSTYSAAVNDMQYFNKQHDVRLLKPVLQIYENPAFIRSKASEVIYHFIKLETDSRNDETFYKVKELVEKNTSLFDKNEIFSFYIGFHNYLFEQSLKPGTNLAQLEQIMRVDFETTVNMLALDLPALKESMPAEWFVNIFLKAIRANEIKFAEKFITDHKNKLTDKERDNVVNYAYGELEITKKNYIKALDYLAKIKFNNVWEKLRVNHMYIKIHYETNNSELFYYLADSFKHIIRDEQSVNEYIKQMYGNFIKYLIPLFRLKSGEKNVSLSQVKKGALSSVIAGNKWLLQKIAELEK